MPGGDYFAGESGIRICLSPRALAQRDLLFGSQFCGILWLFFDEVPTERNDDARVWRRVGNY